jgi:hypothetical protein
VIDKDIEAFGSLVDSWAQDCKKAMILRDSVTKHRGLWPDAELFAVADDILAPSKPFADADAAKAKGVALDEHARAVDQFVRAHGYYTEAKKLWGRLEPGQREALADANPDVYWRDVVARLRSLPELQEERVLVELRSRLRRFRIALAAPPEADTERAIEAVRAEDVVGADVAATGATVRRATKWPEADALKSFMRRIDVLDFLLATVATTAVFTATLYVDKNFGTAWQYLAALVAGISGQLAINWQLLPWFRSYMAASTVKI